MKYKAQFSLGWQGTWPFDASDDVNAWNTAYSKIKEHAQAGTVKVAKIWELNDSGKSLRELPNQEECEKIIDEALKLYKAWFINGDCTEPYKAIDDVAAWKVAKKITKVDWIEELHRPSESHIRKLDSYSKCVKIRQADPGYKKRIINKQIDKQGYIVRFIFGDRSGPFVAVDDDEAIVRANELAKGRCIITLEKIEMIKKGLKLYYKVPITPIPNTVIKMD